MGAEGFRKPPHVFRTLEVDSQEKLVERRCREDLDATQGEEQVVTEVGVEWVAVVAADEMSNDESDDFGREVFDGLFEKDGRVSVVLSCMYRELQEWCRSFTALPSLRVALRLGQTILSTFLLRLSAFLSPPTRLVPLV
jgi:hypothetical protein